MKIVELLKFLNKLGIGYHINLAVIDLSLRTTFYFGPHDTPAEYRNQFRFTIRVDHFSHMMEINEGIKKAHRSEP